MTRHVPSLSRIECISIHIPRVGDDNARDLLLYGNRTFQSTSPAWGMTDYSTGEIVSQEISIHIPRVGDDSAVSQRPRSR